MELRERSQLNDEAEQLKHKMRTGKLSPDLVNILAQLKYEPALRLFPIKTTIRSKFWQEVSNFQKAIDLLTVGNRRLLSYACAKRLLPLIQWHPKANHEFLRKIYRSKDKSLAGKEALDVMKIKSSQSDSLTYCFSNCIDGMKIDSESFIVALCLQRSREIWEKQKTKNHDERQVQVDSIAKLLLAQSEK